MNTRRAQPEAPLSQERYMSSPEFLALRGVSAIAAAAKAAITLPGYKRDLIWAIQGMGLQEGGLRKFASDFLAKFQDRLGTETMHRIGIDPKKMVPWTDAHQIHWELDIVDALEILDVDQVETNRKPVPMKNLIDLCTKAALNGLPNRRGLNQRGGSVSLEAFLIDLCINPRLQISVEAKAEPDEAEMDLAKDQFRDLKANEFQVARLPYFRDVIGALLEYMRNHSASVASDFQHTAISRKIWETLDFALLTRNMVLIDGLEGRGKSEATKAWCQAHLSQARFVSLKGINNKTTAFREIAKALGIASSYGYKSTELQSRIEDVLQRSKLMLVLDEAHFIFNQRERIYTRPELVDWIDTAICNHKIGIGLVTTPQFMVCMTRAAEQVSWNYRQFRRRVKRYVKLSERNTEPDIEAVIRKALPGATKETVKLVLGYAVLSKRDLSAVGDVVDEIKAIQGSESLSRVTFDQAHAAIYQHLIPSDTAFARALDTIAKGKPSRKRHTPAPAEPLLLESDPQGESENEEIPASRLDRSTAPAPRRVNLVAQPV